MGKLLAVIAVSTFALASVSGIAADTAKKEDLTKEQRTEMRNRAEQLKTERAANPNAQHASIDHAADTKTHSTAKKSKHAKKSQPQT